MIICCGIFLGGLIFGLQTVSDKYNLLVNPGEPLAVISVDRENNEINLLGEKYKLPAINEEKLQEQVGKCRSFAAERYHGYLEYFKGHF